MASGLSTEDEGKQANTLLYCLGEDAGEVFAACDATEYDKIFRLCWKDTYSVLLMLFEASSFKLLKRGRVLNYKTSLNRVAQFTSIV